MTQVPTLILHECLTNSVLNLLLNNFELISVEAISGSNTTLTCPLQGSSFQWQKLVNSTWSTLQQGEGMTKECVLVFIYAVIQRINGTSTKINIT
jgi:hypothetical protein